MMAPANLAGSEPPGPPQAPGPAHADASTRQADGWLRWRWPVAAAAGLLAAFATLTMSLGDVLTAYGRPAAALQLPFNRTLPAWRLLEADRGKPATAQMRQLAERSLAASPLAAAPLTWLGLAEQAQGNRNLEQRFFALASITGWQDEVAQRQLYNQAIRRGDHAAALRHADALLRQGLAREELFGRFDLGLARPAFRRAMADMMLTSPGWPRDYLAMHGARIDDAALAALLDARVRRDGTLRREIAVPLMSGLLSAGRDGAAAAAWKRVAGADGVAAGVLPWRDGGLAGLASPFDWQLPDGYRLEGGEEGILTAGYDVTAEPVRRFVALAAGAWRIAPSQQDGVAGAWSWSLACRNQGAVSWQALGAPATANATVPAGCPVQVLALRRMPGVDDARLPPVQLLMEPAP